MDIEDNLQEMTSIGFPNIPKNGLFKQKEKKEIKSLFQVPNVSIMQILLSWFEKGRNKKVGEAIRLLASYIFHLKK